MVEKWRVALLIALLKLQRKEERSISEIERGEKVMYCTYEIERMNFVREDKNIISNKGNIEISKHLFWI